MASTQERLSLSSPPSSMGKAFCEDKDPGGFPEELPAAGSPQPSPELLEDVRERGALPAELLDGGSSPGTAAVLTSISEDARDHFENSVLQLREQDEPEPGLGGFLEGLFGCLRPVWNIIGKAYSTDYKLQQQGKGAACHHSVVIKWLFGTDKLQYTRSETCLSGSNQNPRGLRSIS
uniref:Uncharacterized protein n=1 Tax=Ficedula albicollis TaxID=59894 RepID=A0A803VER1_FICAL